MRTLILYFLIVFLFDLVTSSSISSQSLESGDLTKQTPIEKKIYLKGSNGKIHYFEPQTLNLETGNLYKLKIINLSDSKHYFSSPEFAKSIFTRKVQVMVKKEKVAEIKGIIDEVEVFPNQYLEWWFVPIKTGEFNDLHCSIVDEKSNKKHSEMGMIGKIIIK